MVVLTHRFAMLAALSSVAVMTTFPVAVGGVAVQARHFDAEATTTLHHEPRVTPVSLRTGTHGATKTSPDVHGTSAGDGRPRRPRSNEESTSFHDAESAVRDDAEVHNGLSKRESWRGFGAWRRFKAADLEASRGRSARASVVGRAPLVPQKRHYDDWGSSLTAKHARDHVELRRSLRVLGRHHPDSGASVDAQSGHHGHEVNAATGESRKGSDSDVNVHKRSAPASVYIAGDDGRSYLVARHGEQKSDPADVGINIGSVGLGVAAHVPNTDINVNGAHVAIGSQTRRDIEQLDGVPGSIDIISAASNSSDAQKIGSLFLSPAGNGTTSPDNSSSVADYVFDASGTNHTRLFLVALPPDNNSTSSNSSTSDNSTESSALIRVALKLATFDPKTAQQKFFCVTFNPYIYYSPLYMRYCFPFAMGEERLSQTFAYDPKTSQIRPMWSQGNGNGTSAADNSTASPSNQTAAASSKVASGTSLDEEFGDATRKPDAAAMWSTSLAKAKGKSFSVDQTYAQNVSLVFKPEMPVALLPDTPVSPLLPVPQPGSSASSSSTSAVAASSTAPAATTRASDSAAVSTNSGNNLAAATSTSELANTTTSSSHTSSTASTAFSGAKLALSTGVDTSSSALTTSSASRASGSVSTTSSGAELALATTSAAASDASSSLSSTSGAAVSSAGPSSTFSGAKLALKTGYAAASSSSDSNTPEQTIVMFTGKDFNSSTSSTTFSGAKLALATGSPSADVTATPSSLPPASTSSASQASAPSALAVQILEPPTMSSTTATATSSGSAAPEPSVAALAVVGPGSGAMLSSESGAPYDWKTREGTARVARAWRRGRM